MNEFKGRERRFREPETDLFLREEEGIMSIPKTLDYRNHPGVLSPVKNQGSCGSCWAFSCTESIESAVAIAKNETAPVLSPQEIVDCTPNPNDCGGTGGCQGATP